MAHFGTNKLDRGDPFPEIELFLTNEDKLTVPDQFTDTWSVIIIYRGNWCPHCCRQLSDFQNHFEEFRKRHIHLVAASAETLEKAQETRESLNLTFPVAYGLVPREISILTGAYYNREKQYLHACAFIVGPGAHVELAVYSSGGVGRLTAQEVLEQIDQVMKPEQQ
jgi:peroxiredoxin